MDTSDIEEFKIKSEKKLGIAFLGGCGAFGMNLTAYVFREKLFIVDAGIMFSPPHLIGIEACFPNINSFMESFGGPEAYILTHGHEDHIGAMPVLIQGWPAPIFGTSWTIELLKAKFKSWGISKNLGEFNIVSSNEISVFEDVSFQWFHVNHSIPMACALGIDTPVGRVFHSGDFKIDNNSEYEEPAHLESLRIWSQKPVDIMICDSTNAETKGESGTEASVQTELAALISESDSDTYIATFSSNLWRLLSVLRVALSLGRPVFIEGTGIHKCLELAKDLFPQYENLYSCIQDHQKLGEFKNHSKIILTTGCQGEHRAALARVVAGNHPRFTLKPADRIILSSRIIPGNESSVYNMVSQAVKSGAEVISTKSNPRIHVSGHAHQDEILQIFNILQPRTYIPVHGTHSQLIANGNLIGDKARVLQVENGSAILAGFEQITEVSQLNIDLTYIDSWSKIPLSYNIMRERHKIGDSGLAILSGLYDSFSKVWLTPLKIELFGLSFPLHFDQAKWESQLRHNIESTINNVTSDTFAEATEQIRISTRKSIVKFLVKKPVVMIYIQIT